MDWDHACVGWGMHDGVPIHPIGSISIGELRMRGEPRQPGGDKCDLCIFPFDDLDMLLCDLPHNWNFRLCCWNDLCLEFLCDDIDYAKMPALNEWHCKCMTFDDERHQFIHRVIMPVRVEEPDGFERCPRWELPALADDEAPIEARWESIPHKERCHHRVCEN